MALVIEIDQTEAERQHEMQARVVAQDGQEIAKIQGGFQARPGDHEPGEKVYIPLVLDLRNAPIATRGAHDVKLYVDGLHQQDLSFWVTEPRPAHPAEGPSPTRGEPD